MVLKVKYEDRLCHTVLVRLTPSLFHNLVAQADGYGMQRATFIRALLENIDDEKQYQNILGPKPESKHV